MTSKSVSGLHQTHASTCEASVKLSPPTNQHRSLFTGRMPFLSPNQQCQSTGGKMLRTSLD